MPILDVFDDDGRPIANASFIVWATMLVPAGRADERWNLHMAAQAANEALASGRDAIMIDRATFVQLYDRGRASVERDSERRQRDGEQVGDMFLAERLLDREQPAAASRGKSLRLHALDVKDQHNLLHAPSKLREAGDEFLPAAPLWAAYRLLLRDQQHGDGAALDWYLLLALAERFRRWGERHHSPTGRSGTGRKAEPTLAAGTAWRAPSHAILPHGAALRLDRRTLIPGPKFAEMVRNTPV